MRSRLALVALTLAASAAKAQDTTARSIPAAVVTAKRVRGPADTVRNLERSGFYDRRISSGAPAKAFATEKELSRVSMLSELVRLTGRQLCAANLYVDGVKVNIPQLNAPRRGATRVSKDGIDAMLDPWQVVGVEFYKPADTPSEFKTTSNLYCGATLIWTR